jgi:RNA polymerase sigma-70 factor (ECF subfamily)
MDSLKTEFLKEVNDCQGIITRISRAYERDPEARKDLKQEILFQLWKSYPSFRRKSKFSTWLYRVTLNTAITYYGKLKRSNQNEVNVQEIPDKEDEKDIKEDMVGEMYIAIGRLGKIDKALILLFLEDKSYEEIAEIMGMTTSNVGVRLLRAKKKLEADLKQKTQDI